MAQKVDSIIIHCSASKEGVNLKAADIDKMHKQRGFRCIGYHFVINLDGTIEEGRPVTMQGAHCDNLDKNGVSYNRHSIGICYIGGLDKNGKAKDTRTEAQKGALRFLVNDLKQKYGIKVVLGHRDTYKDLNGDGVVDRRDWLKACPCFDVRSEFSE